MRPRWLSPFLLVLVATPLQGQVCHPEPVSDIGSLFPDQIAELGREFYTRQGDCTTNLYRPLVVSSDEGGPWAVVSIEPNADPFLGDAADGLTAHYARSSTTTIAVEGWPVSTRPTQLGVEFVALRGAFRVTVIVRDSADPAERQALASTILREIFDRIPCSSE